jgi:hypothetical protein
LTQLELNHHNLMEIKQYIANISTNFCLTD